MVGAETDGGCRMRLEEGEGARSSLGLHGQGNPPAGVGGGHREPWKSFQRGLPPDLFQSQKGPLATVWRVGGRRPGQDVGRPVRRHRQMPREATVVAGTQAMGAGSKESWAVLRCI